MAISIPVALLTGGVHLLFSAPLPSAGVAAATFLVTYVLARIFIHQYVVQRIKPIYRTVFGGNAINPYPEKPKDRDVIETIGDNLRSWAEMKTTEISRLKEMEKYRKEFLGNVSHELKTPVFTLQGYILTLLDGGLHDERINMRYLEQCDKNLDRLIAIVKDLEQVSKLESGEVTLNTETFDIAALANEVAEMLQYTARDMRIVLKVQPHPPTDVNGDRKLIERALMNLVLNSIHYGREDGMTHIRFVDLFDKIMVEVEDNGIGISEEHIPRLFERFYRVDRSRSRDQGGTGLGLSIVKHIVEAHGENITVRSKQGEGTTFSFTLSKPK